MNGYLVVMCCTMDDVPIQFHERKEDAVAHARSIDASDNHKFIDDHPFNAMKDLTSFVCVVILEFRNGLPCGEMEVIECETAAD